MVMKSINCYQKATPNFVYLANLKRNSLCSKVQHQKSLISKQPIEIVIRTKRMSGNKGNRNTI